MVASHDYKKGGDHAEAKAVVCLNTKEFFPSAMDASIAYNLHHSSLCLCCRGERTRDKGRRKEKCMSCGKLEDGTKLVWRYFADYEKMTEEEIKKVIKDANACSKGKNNHKAKMVICITTKEIFPTLTEASRKYNISNGNITCCCKRGYGSCGKLTDGTKLNWMYLSDFLEKCEFVLL